MTEEHYNELLFECFGTTSPTQIQAPFFGSSVDLSPLRLSEPQVQDLTKLLYLIAHRHPHLEFIPIFPAIAGILMSFYPDRIAYSLLEVIIKSGNSNSSEMKEWPFFPQNRRESLIFSRIFDELLLKFLPNISRHISKLQAREPEFNPRWNRLLAEFFIGLFPNSFIYKIFDAYLIEGYKVPIRFALAHVVLLQDALLQCQTGSEFQDCLMNCFFRPSIENIYGSTGSTIATATNGFPYPFKVLQKTAYSLKFSRNILVRFTNRHRKLSLEDFEECDRAIIFQKPLPKLSRTSQFLTDQDWANIWSWIPARFKILDLELIFITSEHGYRLGTLFEKAFDCEPLLLLIETTDGNIFGAYLSKSLRNRSSHKFFGTGESFIFNLRPSAQVFPWKESHENLQFIYADENFLAIGCSSGKFGIWIDRDLNQVISSPCDTFRNPSFIDNESGWSDIYCIEVYRFK